MVVAEHSREKDIEINGLKGTKLTNIRASGADEAVVLVPPKKMTLEDIQKFRDTLHLDIPDEKLDKYLPPYYMPAPDSEEAKYLAERRAALGGSIPRRRSISRPLTMPADSVYESVKRGSGQQEIATTMAFVRMLKDDS